MKHKEKVLYTIYRGKDLSPVKIFRERNWICENRVTLNAAIIGKSHRIFFHANGNCFTEYIAYPIRDMTPNPIDHFPLEMGKTYCKKYGNNDLACQVDIGVSPVLFEDMDSFLNFMGESATLEVLQYRFKTESPESGEAFTGIALDISGNKFYTIHTYPEQGVTIHSKSAILSSIFSAAQ